LGGVDLMELQHGSSEAILEIRRDVERLQGIAERFSKIGSLPDLQPEPLSAVVKSTLDYLRPRIRHSILFEFQNHLSSEEDLLPLNKPLFSWALENIIRNGVDAIQGPGKITLVLSSQGKRLVLDITDTGKGIPRRMRKKIFQAGFTTKKRGWGLGLSLARRIVREYHKGRIFVKWSEPEKGTTFRLFFSLPPVS
jgi:two-component system, sporulation sensor kinase D